MVGNVQTSIIPEVPPVANDRPAQEVAGVMDQDIEQNGNVPEEGFVRGVSIILLGHIHKHKNLI